MKTLNNLLTYPITSENNTTYYDSFDGKLTTHFTPRSMENIGGRHFVIKNPSSNLRGVYFETDSFKKYLGITEENRLLSENEDGTYQVYFTVNDPNSNKLLREKFDWQHITAEAPTNRTLYHTIQWQFHKTVPILFDPPKEKQFLFLSTQAPNQDIMKPPSIRPVCIIFNGSGTTADMHYRGLLPSLLKRNINVLIYNYPSARITGIFRSKEKMVAEAESVLRYVKEKYSGNLPDEKIILYGHSLGGAIAAHLSASHPNINLVLDRTFNNMNSAVESVIDNFNESKSSFLSYILKPVAKLLVNGAIGNLDVTEAIQNVNGNIFIITASRDRLLSTAQLTNAPPHATTIPVPTGHDMVWLDDPNYSKANQQFDQFLKKCDSYGSIVG